jgi:cation:H+ antiporter
MAYVGLIGGFVILLASGDLLVRGAVSLTAALGVPALVIGLTVVAFGTSAPELFISVKAALGGLPGLAVGNIVGSNIANVLLILGLPALIAPTRCDQPYVGRNTVYVVAASLLFIAMGLNGPLAVWQGALLFSLIVLFLCECGRRAYAQPQEAALLAAVEDDVETVDGVAGLPHGRLTTAAFLLAGLVGLPLSAHLVVDSATRIAGAFGVSEAAIGLTIVAFGTSLPELATTLAAALRGHCALAVGNVLGSNLFNILAILGITAMLTPVTVPDSILRYDVWIMLAAAIAVVPFALRHGTITRVPAALFVAGYCLYVYYVLVPAPGAVAAMP